MASILFSSMCTRCLSPSLWYSTQQYIQSAVRRRLHSRPRQSRTHTQHAPAQARIIVSPPLVLPIQCRTTLSPLQTENPHLGAPQCHTSASQSPISDPTRALPPPRRNTTPPLSGAAALHPPRPRRRTPLPSLSTSGQPTSQGCLSHPLQSPALRTRDKDAVLSPSSAEMGILKRGGDK